MEPYKKVELHLHLDGSLRPETVLELGIKNGLIPKETDIKEIKKQLTVAKDNSSLVDYLKRFDLPIKILQSKEALERAAFELAEDLASENTIYAEIRVAPIQHLKEGLTPDDVVEAILKGFNVAKKCYSIEINLLLCAMRHLTPEKNEFLIDLTQKYRERGVVGLDLAGDEAGYPPTLFREFFKKAKEENIPFTIHAGEARGPKSILEAIEMGASRLGHGIRAYEESEVVELIKEKNICLECCPVSNFNTKAIENFYSYPIVDYLKREVAVTLNSDNRTVSNTNYDKEIDMLKHYIDIDKKHIKQMNINAINHAFIPNRLKERLLEEIKR